MTPTNYPLIGSEQDLTVSPDAGGGWALSLGLHSLPSPDTAAPLLEGIDEVVFNEDVPIGDGDLPELGRIGIRGEVPQANLALSCWQVSVSPTDVPGIDAELETWSLGQVSKRVVVLRPDSQILKNTALIRQLRESRPELDGIVVETVGHADSDPELLIHQTIQLMSGVLGGVKALRVTQSKGEPFSSLWSRLNIARLLKWEAQMGESSHSTRGAGLFSEIQN